MKQRYQLCASAMLLAACTTVFAADAPRIESIAVKIARAASFAGSAGSFAYWLKPTVEAVSRYGILGATQLTYIPRLAIDAACATGAVAGDSSSPWLNAACLLGSLASCYYWAPAICASIASPVVVGPGGVHFITPIFLARGAIDIFNTIMAGKRLYQQWKQKMA